MLKRQFGYGVVRYRGLKKDTLQLKTLFALSNLWIVRHTLMSAPKNRAIAAKAAKTLPVGSGKASIHARSKPELHAVKVPRPIARLMTSYSDGMGASLLPLLALRPGQCQIDDSIVNIEMEPIMEHTVIAVDIAKKVFQLH